MTGRTDDELIADAVGWFLRLRENSDEASHLSLRRWMAMDLRHVAALDLVERGWTKAGAPEPNISPPPSRRRCRARRGRGSRVHVKRALGWAAGLAAVFIALVGAEHHGLGLGWPRTYAAINDAKTIALADGSLLRLRPHSQATVRQSLFSRRVALNKGGGMFTVAHEGRRSFVVWAGAVGVEATGTRFSVDMNPAGTHVALWQGGVRLRAQASGKVLAYMKPGDRADIGSVDRVTLTRAPSTPQVFVFDNTPLADAVAQIGKDTGLEVRFLRSDLARLPISSVYHGNDLQAFLNDLKVVEPICWRQRDNLIEIFDLSKNCKDKATAL